MPQPNARLLSVYRIAAGFTTGVWPFKWPDTFATPLPVNNPALFFATIFFEAVYFFSSYINSVVFYR